MCPGRHRRRQPSRTILCTAYRSRRFGACWYVLHSSRPSSFGRVRLAHDAGPIVDEGVVDWRFAGMARLRDMWRKVVKQSGEKSVLRCMMASGVELAASVARAVFNGLAGRGRSANALCCGTRVLQMRLMSASVPSSALQGLQFASTSLGCSSFFHTLVMNRPVDCFIGVGQNANIYLQRPLLSIRVNCFLSQAIWSSHEQEITNPHELCMLRVDVELSSRCT